MTVGVLALQGAVELHQRKLEQLGTFPRLVKRAKDLEGLSGIILPGGESSTMVHLLKLNDLWAPLQNFTHRRAAWGVCAGAILLAKRVTGVVQPSLGIVDIEAERNGYGRQRESFVTALRCESPLARSEVEGVFIRAPKLCLISGGQARAIVFHGENPVMFQQNRALVSAFHPELTSHTLLHEHFLSFCRAA